MAVYQPFTLNGNLLMSSTAQKIVSLILNENSVLRFETKAFSVLRYEHTKAHSN